MKTPDYADALRHGWQMIKNHKALWFFGVFATLLGQMGIFDLLVRVSTISNQAGLSTGWIGPTAIAHVNRVVGFIPFPIEGYGWLAFAVILAFGIILFLAVIAAASQGTIIHATAQLVKGKKLNLEKAWHKGMGHVWKLLCLHILKIASILLLGLAVGWGVYAAVLEPTTLDRLVFLGIFLLAAICGMIISFLVIYAAGYVVVEEYGVGEAIAAAWKMFTGHWLVSLEVGFIFILFNFVLVALSAVGIVLFFFPVILLGAAAILTSATSLYVLGLVLGNIVFFAFVMLVGGIFTAFTTCVWTYLFMKMHKTGVKSRLIHWLTQKHA